MDNEEKSFVLFGRDIMKIPCFRTAFLYSISSYVGVGLTTFLFTSRPTLSSHVGFTAFVVVTIGYYTDCRIKYSRTKLRMRHIQEKLHEAAVMEGTDQSKRIINTPKLEEA